MFNTVFNTVLLSTKRRKSRRKSVEQAKVRVHEGAPGEVIRELILGDGEAADQSCPEEELLDNHPLVDTESDCDQDGAEDTV